MSTPEQRAELLALADKATPGPWAYEAHGDTGDYGVGVILDWNEHQISGLNEDTDLDILDPVTVEVKGVSNAAYIAAARRAVNKFDDIFIDAARSLKGEPLPTTVQAMMLVESTNTLLHDVPACCPGAYQAEAWRLVRKHHNAIIDAAYAKMTPEEKEQSERFGHEIYDAVADYLKPENQDALMRAVKIAA